jgi:hypothetical protein
MDKKSPPPDYISLLPNQILEPILGNQSIKDLKSFRLTSRANKQAVDAEIARRYKKIHRKDTLYPASHSSELDQPSENVTIGEMMKYLTYIEETIIEPSMEAGPNGSEEQKHFLTYLLDKLLLELLWGPSPSAQRICYLKRAPPPSIMRSWGTHLFDPVRSRKRAVLSAYPTLRYLLDHGANPNSSSRYRGTCGHQQCISGWTISVKDKLLSAFNLLSNATQLDELGISYLEAELDDGPVEENALYALGRLIALCLIHQMKANAAIGTVASRTKRLSAWLTNISEYGPRNVLEYVKNVVQWKNVPQWLNEVNPEDWRRYQARSFPAMPPGGDDDDDEYPAE